MDYNHLQIMYQYFFSQFPDHNNLSTKWLRDLFCLLFLLKKLLSKWFSKGQKVFYAALPSKQNIEPLLVYCWVIISDNGLTLNHHLLDVSCILDKTRGEENLTKYQVDRWQHSARKRDVEPVLFQCNIGLVFVRCPLTVFMLTGTLADRER